MAIRLEASAGGVVGPAPVAALGFTTAWFDACEGCARAWLAAYSGLTRAWISAGEAQAGMMGDMADLWMDSFSNRLPMAMASDFLRDELLLAEVGAGPVMDAARRTLQAVERGRQNPNAIEFVPLPE